jgi:hypothetical protein
MLAGTLTVVMRPVVPYPQDTALAFGILANLLLLAVRSCNEGSGFGPRFGVQQLPYG